MACAKVLSFSNLKTWYLLSENFKITYNCSLAYLKKRKGTRFFFFFLKEFGYYDY